MPLIQLVSTKVQTAAQNRPTTDCGALPAVVAQQSSREPTSPRFSSTAPTPARSWIRGSGTATACTWANLSPTALRAIPRTRNGAPSRSSRSTCSLYKHGRAPDRRQARRLLGRPRQRRRRSRNGIGTPSGNSQANSLPTVVSATKQWTSSSTALGTGSRRRNVTILVRANRGGWPRRMARLLAVRWCLRPVPGTAARRPINHRQNLGSRHRLVETHPPARRMSLLGIRSQGSLRRNQLVSISVRKTTCRLWGGD